MLKRFLIFLVLNFAALAFGAWIMGDAVSSEWYTGLNKAPWTPPGWMFGAAWFSIMVLFAFYMALLTKHNVKPKKLWTLYELQWALNVMWSAFFFNWEMPLAGLIDIILLTATLIFFMLHYRSKLGYTSLLALPYVLWLCIATSLNAYILLYN